MNRIWIIGASEGIGRELAKSLTEEGNYLIASARNKKRLDQLKEEIGNNLETIDLDVSDINSIKKAWNKIEKSGGIDKIIYAAGIYKPMSAKNFELEISEKIIDINLTGAIRILHFVIPYFIKEKKGHIALIGSVAGYVGLPDAFAYGPSKAGIIHLAENLKVDLAKDNIKIQVINPGFVETRLTNMNNFYMPSLISPKKASEYIMKILQSDKFDTRFPPLFPNFIKFISILPYFLYFKIANLIKPKKKSYETKN